MNPRIGELTKRQFHARYPLQIKRRLNKGRSRRSRSKSSVRDGVREVFLSFATAIAAAEDPMDGVRVLAEIDRYVDRAIKAARG